ncbi:calcium-binding protein [Cupriavidus sp. USMAA2-4]|uniref:calcium-binding protein n=1 Tax=Cupriavidus sp. USMAA2-4 TaxID=876364 RepID=UPI001E4A1990|nr:hypothetical protein [Cupriavidus sp. USMAA2-4]
MALTSVQRQAISSLNESTRGIPAALSQLALPSEAAATQLLSMALASRVGLFDSFMSSNNITLPESRERAALLSMWYQTPNYFRKGGKSTTLTKALVAGNRAEVWFQMRYGSSGSLTHPDPGIVRRRYAESTYFSLYDGGNVDQAQAMQIYQMFTLHRKKMMDYDTRQAAQMAATGGTPGYGIGVPRLTDPDGLGRAENVLLVTLGNKYGVISDIASRGIVATGIYVNPQRLEADVVSSLNFNADLDERSVTANSLLIGGNGNSSLYGGGNDILIAGNGDQFLSGGAGSDTLIGGVGADTLDGGTGKGDVSVYTIPAVAGQIASEEIRHGGQSSKIELADGTPLTGSKTVGVWQEGIVTWVDPDTKVQYQFNQLEKNLTISNGLLGDVAGDQIVTVPVGTRRRLSTRKGLAGVDEDVPSSRSTGRVFSTPAQERGPIPGVARAGLRLC